MILLFFCVLTQTTTKPGDLVNLLYKRSGHAFVPETQAQFVIGFDKPRRSEVELKNFARRWDLLVPSKGGFARAVTVRL